MPLKANGMADIQQTWLTLEQLSLTLKIGKNAIKSLVRKRELVVIGHGSSRRFLDPTPEYAERLRLAYNVNTRRLVNIPEIDIKNAFTVQEAAILLGWTQNYTGVVLHRLKTKRIKAGRYTLLSAETIRDLIWRHGRNRAKNRSPFLLSELIEWFAKYLSEQEAEVPTDKQFADDDLLQKKITRMAKMKSPYREMAFKDFYNKVRLAKIATFPL